MSSGTASGGRLTTPRTLAHRPAMTRMYDVAIVGGGIAGGALACALSRGGLEVLLLERQVEYRDRVLGEGMMPWGVAEARRAGVEDVLLDNRDGTVTLTHWLGYEMGIDPTGVEVDASPLGQAVAGIDGILDVRHPVACEAFVGAASVSGATVVRGATEVVATFGPSPSVSWVVDGAQQQAPCRIVVGADGKVSMMRRLASIDLHEEPAATVATGMLAGGLDDAPATMGYSLHETDRHLISFPQTDARARLYVCMPIVDRSRFTGEGGVKRFLAAWDSPSLPFGSAIAAGRQEGPCGTFPLNSASVDDPVREGLVLIGDAAGWIDPLIGQGLSMAMRDVRSVAEVLLGGADRSPSAFATYVEERRERLAILALRGRIGQRLEVDFSTSFSPRRVAVAETLFEDDVFGPLISTQLRGPDLADRRVLRTAERARLAQILGVVV